MKRPHKSPDNGDAPRKKRIVSHEQHKPQHIEPAPQLPSFAGGQLMRSITSALRLAGYDSVMPSALEMFRGMAEEYMLRFTKEVKLSMAGQRRVRPVAQDFTSALAHMSNTRAPRVLTGQLTMHLPEEISAPLIPEPAAAPTAIPDLSALLQPLIDKSPPAWVPHHFPQLPSRHTWKSTDVWPTRETDARKMRERATEEGMLAEQALRKLAAAAKAGALQDDAKRRHSNALSGVGKVRRVRANNEDLLRDVLQDLGAGTGDQARKLDQDDGPDAAGTIFVNSAAAHWRGGKRQGVAF